MKTWGSWAKVVGSIGAVALVGILMMVIASRHAGKMSHQSRETVSSALKSGTARVTQAKENRKWIEAYGKLPLSFEENQGQTAREVRYVSHGSGYELFLTPQEAVLALRPKVKYDLSPLRRTATIRALRKTQQAGQLTAIRMRLEGANPNAQIAGMGQLPGKANYFIGNDPKKWHTDVPSYARVKYSGIYPGVDLIFYGNQRRLEYDFVVAPGADPKAIAFDVEGAKRMRINSDGDLVLSVAGGEVELRKPLVYQAANGGRREIDGRYALAGKHRVAFSIGSYDRSEPLILDPVLNYSTYLGGGADDAGNAIAVDGSGNAFIAGQTFSINFPPGTKGGVVAAPVANSGASFVAEIDLTGANLLYSTYLAGTTTNAGDTAFGIALDPSGKVYVTGSTFATDFPTTMANALNPGPLATNPNGAVFLTKLDPTVNGSNSLIYSTYLAGTGGDFANAVAADAAGNAYVVGLTDSIDYPRQNPFQNTPSNASGTAFLTRIDTTQSKSSSLIYSTYLGGNAANALTVGSLGYGDQAFGVAADSAHNAYLVGATTSNDSVFITTSTAYETAPPAANVLGSVFVSKIDTAQSGVPSLVYSTYLAGSTEDLGNAIALGPAPNHVAYVTGTTNSTDFPSPGPTAGVAFATTGTAFVTLVDTAKSGSNSVPYTTYLGGSGGDTGFAIQVDGSGNAYVAGTATSPDLGGAGTLKALGAFQPTISNTSGTPFIAKLNPNLHGSAGLLYATYFGGSGDVAKDSDQGFGIAIDAANPPNAYVTGQTFSADLPLVSALSSGGALHGTSDAFVAKLALIPRLAVLPASLSFGTQAVGATSVPQIVTLTNNTGGAITFTSAITYNGNPPGSPPVPSTSYVATNTCGTSIPAGGTCTISVTFRPGVVGPDLATLVITDSDPTSPQNVSLSGAGAATAPGVSFAPTTLAFGGQLLTTTSAAKTVTLTNNGTSSLTINSIAASGDFAQTNTCGTLPAMLASGANCTINVTFAPTAVGARSGTLTVTDNAGGSPHTAPLTGTGWDFTVAAPATVTVKSGTTGNFNVTITPLGGFNQAVTVACAGAVMPVTCTPTSPVTPADGVTPVMSAVTISAKGMMLPPPMAPRRPISIRQIVPLLLALSLLMCLFMTRRLRLRLGMVTAILIFVALAGCGSSGAKKGTTNLTITASSGGVNKTATVALTIN